MEMLFKILPFALGLILTLTGAVIALYRKKVAIHTDGIITDIAKRRKRYSKVTVTLEAPVVKYSVDGRDYSGISSRFFKKGVMDFKKGGRIKIRISRRDRRRFVPAESGKTAEKLIIACGIFMILANAVILWRYGG